MRECFKTKESSAEKRANTLYLIVLGVAALVTLLGFAVEMTR